MRSSNPVLTRSETFNGSKYQGAVTPNNSQYGSPNYDGYSTYADPRSHGSGGYGATPTYSSPQHYQQPQAQFSDLGAPAGDRMTVDSVIYKSILVIGIVILVASITMALMPSIFSVEDLPVILGVWIVSAIVAFVAGIVVGRMRRISPVGVIIYAVVEGIFIGCFSSVFEALYPGVVAQAVIGTFVAAAVVLALFKFLNVRISGRFMRTVMMLVGAYAIVMLVNFLLSLFGVNLGLTPVEFTWLGVVSALIGATLAVLSLMSDLTQIEASINAGAPEKESWRAAFALTVTMVWLYVEILRLLSYLNSRS